MKYTTCIRALASALCCLVIGAASVLLAIAGAVPGEAIAPGIAALLMGTGLLVWIVVFLWRATRGETIAYRILYHAAEAPDGSAAMRTLETLARHAGWVILIWCFKPKRAARQSVKRDGVPHVADIAVREPDWGDRANTADGLNMVRATRTIDVDSTIETATSADVLGDLSLYIVAPLAARKALEGILLGLLPGIWAEKCAVPRLLKPPSPGWGVRVWRWCRVPKANVAPIHGGDLADPAVSGPAACGMYLRQLATALSGLGHHGGELDPAGEVVEVEVRLKVWPHGRSGIVSAQCPLSQAVDRDEASSCEPGLSLPFLKPLLGGVDMPVVAADH